ncbi:hypothetical protein BH24DEI2_BH24DEI2_21840 [soil metagenome]
MTNKLKERLAALGVTGMLLTGGALVSAQTQTTPTQTTPTQTTQTTLLQTQYGLDGFEGGRFGLDGHGFGGDFGHGVGFGRLALGTTAEVTFYDADPAAGGTVTDTLDFTYGTDSEAAFAQSLDAARQTAAYMIVNTGEQTRTVDLSTVTVPTNGRGLLPRELASARGLQDGGTVTATFCDGDPAANGQVTDTLTFTYGQDSEAGFANDFTTAAENAAFVTVTTSPQSYTVDLSQVQAQGQDGFGNGFGQRGFNNGRGHR